MNFVRLNEIFNYDCFDIKKFVIEVNNYLSSENKEGIGFSEINKLKRYLLSLRNTESWFDIRTIYIFYEHKFLMRKRLEYMLLRSFVKNNAFVDSYNDIVLKSQKLKGMALKYNMTKNPNIIDRIVAQIDEINNQEKNILRQVLDEVEKLLETETPCLKPV